MLFDIEITKPNIIWNNQWLGVITEFFAKIQETWKIRNQFVILSWPANIGKSTAISELCHQLLGENASRDLWHIRDLSDIWLNIKESNKLSWRSHSIKIESDKSISISKQENYMDYGIREMNSRLSMSPSDKYKIIIIENIERITEEWANAFLKNLEEPLENRLIIATSSNINDVLKTIISRWFIYQWNLVDNQSVQEYIYKIYPDLDAITKEKILKYSAGRPGIANRLWANIELIKDLDNFESMDKLDKFWYLKSLSDKWDLYGFLDIYIWANDNKEQILPKYTQFIKYNRSNLWLENILFDLIVN